MASKEHDFSVGSIPRNIISLALPMTAAQLINVLYSVVDRIYLGRLPGHLALTGLGLTLPIISIVMGFANLCGTGGAPLCSIYRGKGEEEEAERIMGNAFTLLLIFGAAVTGVFLLFRHPLLYLFGASDATYPYAEAYMTIYLLGTVFVMIGLGMNPFITSQGFGRTGMMTVGLGAVVNIVISIVMGFANLCGTGGAPLCSIYRGKGEEEEAERIMGNAFTLLLIFGAAVTGVFLLFRHPLLYLFGASDATYPYAEAYMTIYLLGTVFVMIGLGMNPFITSQGFGRTGMMTVGLGAVVNIVLDPVFIFALDMGVRGAALATVIAQGCSAVWVLKFLTGRKAILRLRLRNLALGAGRVKSIVALGLSGFFMNLTNSLVQVVCNATLQAYGGDLYVGVMTIINSLREVFFMPVQGLTNGAQPVTGYNYGAGRYSRVRSSIRFSVAVTVGYAAVFWAAAMLFPGLLIRVFNSEPEVVAAGIPALRIYFCLFIPMSLQMAGQGVFVSLGRSKQAVFFSLLRKAIINAPLTVVLPIWMGTTGVFTAEAISQLVGGLACSLTMYFTVYRPLGRLPDRPPENI